MEKEKISKTSDMYSFGLIIFELYFPEIKRPHVSVHIHEKKPLEVPSHRNQDLCDLLPQLLTLEPQSRLSSKKALCHRFFSEPWEFSLGFVELNSGWEQKTNRYKSFDFSMNLNEGKEIISSEYSNLQNILKLMDGVSSIRIIRSFAIQNETLKRGFASRLIQMQTRLEEDPKLFKNESWKNKSNGNWREWLKNEMVKFSDQFNYNQNNDLKIVPVFHGAKSEDVAWKICDNGFANLSSLDEGWYGKGIYFTTNLEYALYYAQNYGIPNLNGEYAILLSYVLVGNTYPVIEHPASSDSLKGKPCQVKFLSFLVVLNCLNFLEWI